ncbi:hypothetical protein DPMN_186107 [Dreissena polymorpha]|uniref:Uncharacterized protein n=1 Tax=Dreissena polymorpha TaxID=45954 RepID=A0A9D4I9B2_DREPO|nr:hypothetical protein DPMN_186107 [Dreissena polymorpha]
MKYNYHSLNVKQLRGGSYYDADDDDKYNGDTDYIVTTIRMIMMLIMTIATLKVVL